MSNENTLISEKPKIFAISSQDELLSEIKGYVENYNYEYTGYF